MSHDLHARAIQLAQEKNLTYREALRQLGQHGAAVRNMRLRVAHRRQIRAEQARTLADKISP